MKHLHEGGCPGSRMRMLEQPEAAESVASAPVQPVSRLRTGRADQAGSCPCALLSRAQSS